MAHAVAFSLGFKPDLGFHKYEQLAVAAERMDFEVLSVFGDLYHQPAIVPLVAMARSTTRVRLGPACLNPFVIHPVEIAAQISMLDSVSGGRAYVGLARGSWLDELGVDQHDAPTAIAEAAAVIDALLVGRDSGVEGTRFRLPMGARLRGRAPRRPVPLLIGTWGRRLTQLGGQLASEVKLGGSANPAMAGLMYQRLRDAESGAGRSHGSCGLVVGAVTVVAEDRAAARRRAREEVAMYLDVVADLDQTIEIPGDVRMSLRRRLLANDRSGAASLVSDELLSHFAFAGTPDDVAAQAAAIVDAGASRVEFGTPHGLTGTEGIELLGMRVLPAVRSMLR